MKAKRAAARGSHGFARGLGSVGPCHEKAGSIRCSADPSTPWWGRFLSLSVGRMPLSPQILAINLNISGSRTLGMALHSARAERGQAKNAKTRRNTALHIIRSSRRRGERARGASCAMQRRLGLHRCRPLHDRYVPRPSRALSPRPGCGRNVVQRRRCVYPDRYLPGRRLRGSEPGELRRRRRMSRSRHVRSGDRPLLEPYRCGRNALR